MHDPQTVAFEIKRPWPERDGYYPALVTIWHVDPEADGSDDSCGFTMARLGERDRAWAKKTISGYAYDWFATKYSLINLCAASDLEVLAAVWTHVRHHERGVERWEPLSAWDLGQIVCVLSNPVDNLHSMILAARTDERELARLFLCALRIYRTERRWWFQKPRWHFWHWRVQIRPIQAFKRWAFSRCCWCKGRFSWGYSPVGYSWHGDGPQWFRGETKVAHLDCDQKHTSAKLS